MSINLEEIVERAVPMSQGHYLFIHAEDFGAMAAEIERLREEVHTMRLWAEDAAHAENLNAIDAQAERAAVVAFLREGDTVCMECGDRATLDLAYSIERGEHRKETP